MNKERLLNVARALRESPVPEKFSMEVYVNDQYTFNGHPETMPDDWCGTPACALGHYASRLDLQDLLTFTLRSGTSQMVFTDTEGQAYYEHPHVLGHFDITPDKAQDLFGSVGCGGATSTLEAAEYIEKFVGAAS